MSARRFRWDWAAYSTIRLRSATPRGTRRVRARHRRCVFGSISPTSTSAWWSTSGTRASAEALPRTDTPASRNSPSEAGGLPGRSGLSGPGAVVRFRCGPVRRSGRAEYPSADPESSLDRDDFTPAGTAPAGVILMRETARGRPVGRGSTAASRICRATRRTRGSRPANFAVGRLGALRFRTRPDGPECPARGRR